MDVEGECFEELGLLFSRYYIFHRERSEGRRRFRAYLHKLYRSDAVDVLHDHPWDFFSIVIWRGYVEVSEHGRRRIWPGMIIFRRASWKHRLELNGTAVTFVIALGRSREWGFYPKGATIRIPWNEYSYAQGRC